MDTATRVQILDEADCISQSINTLGKGMNPLIFHPAMGKYQGRLGSSAWIRQPVLEKEKSESKPVKLRLKTDPVSHPVRVEGLVNTYPSAKMQSVYSAAPAHWARTKMDWDWSQNII